MAEPTAIPMDKELVVELTPNAMHAVVRWPVGMDVEQWTEQACVEHIVKAGIAESCIPRDRLKRCIGRYAEDPAGEQMLELNGRPAVHGVNGRLEWFDGMDPTHRFDDHDAGQIDHYNRSHYVTVAKEQPFARIHPPTTGEAGLDLRGGELPPTAGKPAQVTLAPSVICDNDGICHAGQAGVVTLEGQTIRIDPILSVPGTVDFSTGNIRFEGDVQIGGGVCDRFIVRATGDVEIKQMIGAAAIDVGGNLRALGGMAAKEKGHIRVGGHMTARYLDNVIGTVAGNLEVERESIGCELTIGGIVQMAKGALIGGVLHCGEAVHVGRIGSMAGVPTMLDVGHVPVVEQNIAHQRQQRREVGEAMKQLQELIDAVGQAASAALLDRRTKLQALDHQIATRIDMLLTQLERERKVDLNVTLFIGPGVTIACGQQMVQFFDQVRGPLHIGRDEQGRLVGSIAGGETVHLAEWPNLRILTRQTPGVKPAQPPVPAA